MYLVDLNLKKKIAKLILDPLSQDIKYDSRFKADSFQVLATDFFLEPLAQFVCIGTSRESQTGDSPNIGAGAGHASMGGGCKCFFL